MSTMQDAVLAWLQSHYLQFKFAHLLAAMIWLWSTSVAYLHYLLPIMRQWQQSPADARLIARRNWAMERFDEGATLEHIAFPLLLTTGLCLLWAGPWGPQSLWLALKLTLVVLVFLPIECCDYWLAHGSGNKARVRRREQCAGAALSPRYEAAIQRHWWFLIASTPAIVATGLSVVYLAVVKPM